MAKDNSTKYKKHSGNACIYFLYNLFNLLFLLSSLLVIGMGAWLWYEVKDVGPFNLSFIILGSVQFLLSLLGQNVKKSKAKMNIYMFLVGLMFIAQALCTSIGIASKSKIIDWAAGKADSPEEAVKIKSLIENNVETALLVTIVPVVIQFFCVWTIYLYRRSFINRNTSKELLIQDDNGQKISLKEKYKRDDAQIKEKWDNKRKQQQEQQQQQKRQYSGSDVESNRSSAVYEEDGKNKKRGKK